MSVEFAVVRQDGSTLCRRCVLADTPLARFRGLMGRAKLADDEGMLLATWSIHTSFMRFPIDVVFLDRGFRVVRVVNALKPWRLAIEWSAHSVVELPAGAAADADLNLGEQLSLVAHSNSVAAVDELSVPPRIAVASSDARFLRVTEFLLERHGFAVETFRDAMELVPDGMTRFAVVIVDGTSSLAEAARVMRTLSAESPGTGVVIVGDKRGVDSPEAAHPKTLRVLPKWDSFDGLVREIHLASNRRSDYELA